MPNTEPNSELGRCVDALGEALMDLVNNLDAEREALRQRTRADELESVALRKAMSVEHVAKNYDVLRERLVILTGDQRVEDAVGHLREHAPELGGRVDELITLIRTCQQANQENGALIGAGLRHTRGALNTLSQLTASEHGETYGASGHTESADSSAFRVVLRA